MTFELELGAVPAGHCGSSRLRALFVATSFALLIGCSIRQEAAPAPAEASASTVAALDNGPPWPEFATLPRYRHAGVELGAGRALVCGGKDNTEVYPANCELLEAQGSTLTSTVYHLPGKLLPGDGAQGRINPTLTLLPTGGVLIAGGRPSANDPDLSRASASRPISDWQQAGDNPSLNWLSPEPLNVAREEQTATLLGTSVVLFGGYNRLDAAGIVGQIEVRTDAGGGSASWPVFGSPPVLEPRLGHSATLLKPNGSEARVLVLGGYDTARGGYLKSGFIFSVEGGVSPIPDMPAAAPARMGHTATLLDDADGSVLVVGGEGASDTANPLHYLGDAWRYDPVTGAWSSAGAASATPLQPRSYHAATRLGSYVIVAGGEGPDAASPINGKALNSVQSYDSTHDAWLDLRSLSQGRTYLQLLKLDETKIVASGGWQKNGGTTPNTSELITLSALGVSSSDATSCASGHQADGVCCDRDCDGPCEACDASGVCRALSGTSSSGHPSCAGNLLCSNGTCPAQCDSQNLCGAGFYCTATGECAAVVAKKGIGVECDADADCANGKPCVDGVCCDSECSGSCESCNQEHKKGICSVLGKDQIPESSHPACAATSDADGDAHQCAAHCDGSTRDRCVFPDSDTKCSAASCNTDLQSLEPAQACDGQGACQAVAVAEQCAPFACDGSSNQCRRSCKTKDDCSADAECQEDGTCARCSLDQCKGFQCDRQADECKQTCQKSETDCVGGYYCHPLEHRCVAAIRFPASELPACSMGMSRRSGYHSLAMAAAVWLLLTARRRRSSGPRAA